MSIKYSKIITESKWKDNLYHEYINCNCDTLVIMLPGNDYNLNKPIFYYLTQLYIDLKYDLLKINYGYQISQSSLRDKSEIITLKDEIFAVISQIEKHYKNLIIIGKSIGTIFINDVVNKLNTPSYKRIFLTPLDVSMPKILNEDTLIIYGDIDNNINENNKNIINNSICKKLIVKNGNHSLETDTIEDNLTIIGDIIKTIRNYTKI